MSKINKILVPVDGSDNACKAVDQAISLAEKAGASLEFVYVSSHINEHIPSDIIFDRIWGKTSKRYYCNKTCRNRLSSKSYYSCSSRN